MKKLLALMGLVVALTLTGCTSDSSEEAVVEQPGQTGEFADIPLTTRQLAQVPVLNSFALKLARQMAVEDKSFVVSPLSVAFVLGMLNEGAEGETQAEIARTLGLGNASREEVNALMAALKDYTQQADPSVTMAYASNVTLNSKKGYQLTGTYSEAMTKYYDASTTSYDFSKPEALTAINSWSREHSRGLIPEIIDQLDENDVMCLLNAIYFKGGWTKPFDKSHTRVGCFRRVTDSGEGLSINMMNETASANYYEEERFQALNLPIGNDTYSMTLVLPTKGTTVKSMLAAMEASELQQMPFTKEEVEMSIPIFKTATETNLIEQLSKLGINKVFDRFSSELTRMVTGTVYPLYVTMMKQKTQLGVNEEGTEGSAVTIGVLKDAMDINQPQRYVFNANRPFAYYISEKNSGAILFMGVFAGE